MLLLSTRAYIHAGVRALKMTKNPMNFMQKQFTQWFNVHSGIAAVESVMVLPCRREDEEYCALVRGGTDFFKNCEWRGFIHKDDYYVLNLIFDNKEFFIYWGKGFEYKKTINEPMDLFESECHPLSHLVFYTKFNIKPYNELSKIMNDGYVFEEELLQMLPKLLTLNLNNDFSGEKFELKLIRVLLYIEFLDKEYDILYEKIIELALSLPEDGHDWLYFELIRAIRSKKQDSMFLCLYKMLEFFFPLNNIFNFSNHIKFNGSILELLEYCRSQLNWNVNHNYGLRAAKDYASHNFCSFLDVNISTIDEVSDVEHRKNKIDQMKSAGLEKLAKLRHALTHQNFKELETNDDEISKSIISIIIFLTESFSEYNNRINR